MIIYRLFAVTWLLTIPVLAHSLLTLTRLKRFKLTIADLALPLYAVALVRVSDTFFTHSFLPHYLAAMALLAIVTCLFLLQKHRNFSLRRFIKLFWRLGFFVTLLAYLVTLVLIFLAKG